MCDTQTSAGSRMLQILFIPCLVVCLESVCAYLYRNRAHITLKSENNLNSVLDFLLMFIANNVGETCKSISLYVFGCLNYIIVQFCHNSA